MYDLHVEFHNFLVLESLVAAETVKGHGIIVVADQQTLRFFDLLLLYLLRFYVHLLKWFRLGTNIDNLKRQITDDQLFSIGNSAFTVQVLLSIEFRLQWLVLDDHVFALFRYFLETFLRMKLLHIGVKQMKVHHLQRTGGTHLEG
uniref:(northern house mosquito) hypothetical protein n=1 Tax=Culex pipiens TaxID=7175 RepID=A0A8D8BFK1_CULPI